MPPVKRMSDKRIVLSMPDELRERVRRYRFAEMINTESEALRTLIEKALDAEEKRGRK